MRLIMGIISMCNLKHAVKPCIHGRVNVADIGIHITFIVYKSAFIKLSYRLCLCIYIWSGRCLISQRPHNYRRMISMLPDHSLNPVNISTFPAFFFIEPFVILNPFKTVIFKIRFIYYI